MINLKIPKFDEFDNYKHIGFKVVKIKNNPDSKDYNKVTNELPGIPQGYCKEFFDLGKIKTSFQVTDFYDIRQNGKALRKLKGHFITIVN